MKPQGEEFDRWRQPTGDAGGEIGKHVFAGRLIIDLHDAVEPRGESRQQRIIVRCAADNKRMIEPLRHLFQDDSLQQPEVHYHPRFRICILTNRDSAHRHEEPVGVAVNLAAGAVITTEQLRRFVSGCFGESMYAPSEVKNIEDRLCRDKHADCMLHFTRGDSSGEARDGEVILQRKVSKNQASLNRKYYADGLTAHRLAIIRLTEKVRNCILVHLDDAMIKSRAGQLDARAVWRAVYLNDGRIFQKHERTTDSELSVDVLLDGSASQLQRQESVAAQAYILAESLTRCGVPVRVYSFCSVGTCTVVRIYRDYDEVKKNEAIFDYAAAGFNRDDLALRAANYMLSGTHYENRLLITLSDCSTNDVNKIVDASGRRREYQGDEGVRDSSSEVERLRRMGVRVMCVFTGEEADLPNARKIYGRELVRIRHISQFADAVGNVIVSLIGSM